MEIIERFFGVYILYSKNQRSQGKTYIGFTVNPNRRITQHNLGKDKGGARKTSGRGPWEMVLIIHGFPNQISALRFEWAWQNPDKSTRLRHLPAKKRSETQFQFKFKVLQQMLRSTPWSRLPLTIRWLNDEYHLNFDPLIQPPIHMATCFGKVNVPTKKKDFMDESEMVNQCILCVKDIEAKDLAKCLHCKSTMHLICLAQDDRLDSESLLPVTVSCNHCGQGLIWGDVIRQHFHCDDQ